MNETIKRARWRKEELEILKKTPTASEVNKLLPHRKQINITARRRLLGLENERRGPKQKTADAFPDVDWSASINSISMQTGLAFVTAKRIKLEVLAKAVTLAPP